MNKQEWVDKINEILTHSEHFITSVPAREFFSFGFCL